MIVMIVSLCLCCMSTVDVRLDHDSSVRITADGSARGHNTNSSRRPSFGNFYLLFLCYGSVSIGRATAPTRVLQHCVRFHLLPSRSQHLHAPFDLLHL